MVGMKREEAREREIMEERERKEVIM